MLWYNVAGPPTHGLWVLRADPTDRYRRVRGREGDEMVYIIAEPCIDVKDKACVEECPVDCIYEGARMLYIHPEECIDCAACEPVCPVEAIFYEDDTPDEWKEFIAVNREWFGDDVSGLGDPGGAAQILRCRDALHARMVARIGFSCRSESSALANDRDRMMAAEALGQEVVGPGDGRTRLAGRLGRGSGAPRGVPARLPG
jgi:NAD-dependent dihydropyrimidine dehydrogenase PreA subunit